MAVQGGAIEVRSLRVLMKTKKLMKGFAPIVKLRIAVLMHDGLILGLTHKIFIFKLVIFVVAFLVAFLVGVFCNKTLKETLDSSKLPSASILSTYYVELSGRFAILAVLQPLSLIHPMFGVRSALGVTSSCLSFGLQDFISNLFGGLGLVLGGVVKPGDKVSIGTISRVKLLTWWLYHSSCSWR